jgi:gas vesicle protein
MSLNINNNNFTDDVQNDANANREGLIKQITDKTDSTISLSESNNDEEMTEKFVNLLNNLIFVEYPNKEDSRRLEIIPKGLLNLRNLLETRIIDTYAMPIYYSYPLFRSNILGTKIGLIAVVAFTPLEGKFYMEMIFEINGKQTTIFSKEKETSFNKIIDNIRVILRRVYIVLSQEDETLQPVFDEHETKIKALLDQLHNDIKDYPSLVNKFKPELDRILDVVYTSTATAYSNLDRASITSVTAFSNLLQEINVGNNQYVNSIKTSSTNAIDIFLSSNQANLNTLYSSWTNFHKNLLTELNKHKQVLQTNSSFTFDLGLYYNITDIMSSILSIYQNFVSNLQNALNIEKINLKYM